MTPVYMPDNLYYYADMLKAQFSPFLVPLGDSPLDALIDQMKAITSCIGEALWFP